MSEHISPEVLDRYRRSIAELRGIPQCACNATPNWENWTLRAGAVFVADKAPSGSANAADRPMDFYEPVLMLICQRCGEIRTFDTTVLGDYWQSRQDDPESLG